MAVWLLHYTLITEYLSPYGQSYNGVLTVTLQTPEKKNSKDLISKEPQHVYYISGSSQKTLKSNADFRTTAITNLCRLILRRPALPPFAPEPIQGMLSKPAIRAYDSEDVFGC